MKEQQHYRLSLEDAITRYKNRELTVKGLLRLYFEIKLKPGWEMKKTPREIYEELGISRASFYANYALLREEGKIIGEDPDEKPLSIRLPICNSGQESRTLDSQSTTLDGESTTLDSESTTLDGESRTLDSKSPNPLQSNNSNDPSYFFQLFINSLSEGERESFLKFAHEKAKAMPNPPQLVEAWIAKHYADLHKQFVSSAAGREAKKDAIAKSKDWRNDPRFNEWIKASFERSEMWVQEDEAEREERNSFHRWAQQVNAYEGVCY